MKRQTRSARFGPSLLWVALVALTAFTTSPLSAQTAEGTVITNTATATYTDANGNTYAAATGSVSVTVGFLGSLSVSSPATASPPSPSTERTIAFTVTNGGNGTDTISVAITSTNAAVATIDSLVYAGVGYADAASLNTVLATTGIAAAGNVIITAYYTVGSGQGGNSSDVELTATSLRTGGDSNSSITVVTPAVTGSLTVVSNSATVDRLPSNGTVLYVASYDVTSGLSGTATIDLVASVSPNAASVVITRIREGPSGSWTVGSSTALSFTAGQTLSIEVEYRVDGTPADAGSSSTLTLTATANSVAGPPTDADGTVVTIVAPSLTVTKSVHASEADAQAGAPALSGNPQPGASIWYRVQVTNNGTATAVMTGGSNGISDDLTGLPITYVASSLNQTGSPNAWTTLAESGGVISGTIAGGLPGGGATAWFVFAVTVN